jgi:hypothetical protein
VSLGFGDSVMLTLNTKVLIHSILVKGLTHDSTIPSRYEHLIGDIDVKRPLHSGDHEVYARPMLWKRASPPGAEGSKPFYSKMMKPVTSFFSSSKKAAKSAKMSSSSGLSNDQSTSSATYAPDRQSAANKNPDVSCSDGQCSYHAKPKVSDGTKTKVAKEKQPDTSPSKDDEASLQHPRAKKTILKKLHDKMSRTFAQTKKGGSEPEKTLGELFAEDPFPPSIVSYREMLSPSIRITLDDGQEIIAPGPRPPTNEIHRFSPELQPIKETDTATFPNEHQGLSAPFSKVSERYWPLTKKQMGVRHTPSVPSEPNPDQSPGKGERGPRLERSSQSSTLSRFAEEEKGGGPSSMQVAGQATAGVGENQSKPGRSYPISTLPRFAEGEGRSSQHGTQEGEGEYGPCLARSRLISTLLRFAKDDGRPFDAQHERDVREKGRGKQVMETSEKTTASTSTSVSSPPRQSSVKTDEISAFLKPSPQGPSHDQRVKALGASIDGELLRYEAALRRLSQQKQRLQEMTRQFEEHFRQNESVEAPQHHPPRAQALSHAGEKKAREKWRAKVTSSRRNFAPLRERPSASNNWT